MLRATECQWTQALRLTLARQLAELLMRGTNGQVEYNRIDLFSHHKGTKDKKTDIY